MDFRPVGTGERIAALDILRGFSLLGILLVNMFGFYLPMPHISDLSSWFTNAQDIILQQLLDIYVQSSFYPLFSMHFEIFYLIDGVDNNGAAYKSNF